MPPQPQPPLRLGVPVRLRNQRVHWVIKPAAHELDVGAAVPVQKVLDVNDIPEGLAYARVFELLEERAGEAQVQPHYILVALEHSHRSVVAPENLSGLPTRLRVVQRRQVPQRLVHVQAKCMIDVRHNEFLLWFRQS